MGRVSWFKKSEYDRIWEGFMLECNKHLALKELHLQLMEEDYIHRKFDKYIFVEDDC